MNKKRLLKNQEGFTLVEIIAVLIILGILAAVAVPRYIDLEANAKDRAIDAAVSELNGRENLIWANIKIGAGGWIGNGGDPGLITHPDYSTDLNPPGAPTPDYVWTLGPNNAGGTLSFQGAAGVALTRNDSTDTTPGTWRR